MLNDFPYRARAMFAFEEQDGVDVCFFGMHVQEYGLECPQPNTRRVYVAYLDSVHFFKPRHFRTAVYHEILLGKFLCIFFSFLSHSKYMILIFAILRLSGLHEEARVHNGPHLGLSSK